MRLAPSVRLSLYATMGVLFVTGIAWLVFRNGTLMTIHGSASMAMLALAGAAASLHVPGAWVEGRNRFSGVALGAAFAVLVATSCLLYYAGDEALRSAASVCHWILGLALPSGMAAHAWRGRASRKGAASPCPDRGSCSSAPPNRASP